MPPTITDITAVRGDTLSLNVPVVSSTGAALDLTSCSVWFTVKLASDAKSDDTGAITKCYWVSGGASSGITVASPSTGVARVDAPASDLLGLNPNIAYVYDVQVEDANSRFYTVAMGRVAVAPDVTRRETTP